MGADVIADVGEEEGADVERSCSGWDVLQMAEGKQFSDMKVCCREGEASAGREMFKLLKSRELQEQHRPGYVSPKASKRVSSSLGLR